MKHFVNLEFTEIVISLYSYISLFDTIFLVLTLDLKFTVYKFLVCLVASLPPISSLLKIGFLSMNLKGDSSKIATQDSRYKGLITRSRAKAIATMVSTKIVRSSKDLSDTTTSEVMHVMMADIVSTEEQIANLTKLMERLAKHMEY